eukprot:485008-Lingulodinium_polyedra.AAC.1
MGWHHRWFTLCRAQAHEGAAPAHGEWFRVLKVMTTYDQLYVSALASAEFVCRQIQVIEERLKESA